jgi:hypothetical protein
MMLLVGCALVTALSIALTHHLHNIGRNNGGWATFAIFIVLFQPVAMRVGELPWSELALWHCGLLLMYWVWRRVLAVCWPGSSGQR